MGVNWNTVGDRMGTGLSSVTPATSKVNTGGPDFEDVNRQAAVGQSALQSLEGFVSWFVDHHTKPEEIPLGFLRRMRYHPMVYLAEKAATGIARSPSLYHVQAKTDKARAEVEAWLWPVLPQLLPQLARAFVYGSSVIVWDWNRREDPRTPDPLVIEYKKTDKEGKTKTVKTSLPGGGAGDYHRIVNTSDVWPGEVDLDTDGRKLRAIKVGRTTYPCPGRGTVAVWDREFGEFMGNGARRRAAPPYIKSHMYERLKGRYVDRSVDPVRILKAPGGKVTTADGVTTDVAALAGQIFASLYGGGTAVLPSGNDENGAPKYEVSVLDLPDRSGVFDNSLNRFDVQILISYLVSPGSTGVQDPMSGGAARVIENMFGSFVEELLEFMACELTKIVEIVWEKNHARGSDVPPEILPNKLPERVQKIYLEVLKTVAQAADLGSRVDVNALINRLNIPLREDAEDADAAPPKGAPAPGRPPGRPRDSAGEREKRREDAPTEDGQEDTGAPREDA